VLGITDLKSLGGDCENPQRLNTVLSRKASALTQTVKVGQYKVD
jgi:hypothetical protein